MGTYLYIWFVLIGIVVALYMVTAGSRLGFGPWYLFSPHDERDYILRSLRPHFEGSELWLFMASGALFFLFPRIFLVVIGGFYPVFGLIVVLLAFRFIPYGMRKVFQKRLWESMWDVCISVCSFVPMFLMGVIAGYILNGIPLLGQGRFNVNLVGYLSHYTIFSGLLILFVMSTLSCTTVAWMSEGIVRINARKWAFYSSLLVCVLFVDLSIWSQVVSPYISDTIRMNPILYILPAGTFLGTLTVPFLLAKRRFKLAYAMSVFVITGLSALFFVSISPHLRTIFFENWTPGINRPRIPSNSRAHVLVGKRETMLPYFILVMGVITAFQGFMRKRFQRHVQCSLPFEEDDDTLL